MTSVTNMTKTGSDFGVKDKQINSLDTLNMTRIERDAKLLDKCNFKAK